MNPLFNILLAFTMVSASTACRRPADRSESSSATSSAVEGAQGPALTLGAPSPEALTRLLGVQVDGAPGEVNQYLIRGSQGSVDLTKIGKIHQDLGYSVGVTLANGLQIGFRYEPLALPLPDVAKDEPVAAVP